MPNVNTNMPSYYSVHTARSPWGDYGWILITGMCSCGENETIHLRRTGPFIPPVSFPGGYGAIIVTEPLRKELETSGLLGLTFYEVVKELIVELPWETWDYDADDPAEIPSSGEPEDYILGRPHSASAAKLMGTIWEARSPRVVECTSVLGNADGAWITAITSDPGLFQQLDFFRTTANNDLVFVSARAKEWLSRKVPDWVRFQSVPLMGE